ncbi:MAG: dienelactone hydrolase family protein [Ilumatobacter sp.]|uniref:dienelactone hydrolase family protein n=1 Tax=Ilumatobacter sp. TaxID=1967498 RepID=UPI00391AB325
MELRHDVLDVDTPDGPMAILVTQPADDGPYPTVVIFHDAPAIRQAIRDFMAKLAGEGYRVATPDLYHRAGRMIGFEPDAVAADPSLRDQMVTLLYSLTDDGIQRDLDATLGALDLADDELLGTIGFCLGARAVVRTLTRLPDRFGAGATWHPSFLADDGDDSPHLTAADIARPLYIGIGTADQVQSIAMHQPFFDAVEPLEHVEVEIFDGADHGFTWPGYATYHQVASDTCFAKTTALFARHLSAGR